MMRTRLNRFVRIWHRRLGVIIGIQFFLWAAGGVYFSWFHIDNVHGDYEVADQEPPNLKALGATVSLAELTTRSMLTEIRDIRVGVFLGRPVIRLHGARQEVEMYDAADGVLLSPITEAQARRIAAADFAPGDTIVDVVRVTEHAGEYKGPIPAFRVSFGNWKNTSVYVHAHSGRITARRNSIWRGFDFLWMLHILDFAEREDINNWFLRIMSVMGIVTLVSGYALWVLVSPLFKRVRRSSG